ncbi:hypothetical protein BC332_08057 [Capsicum chinense]|nr:hypothetical protein BC332_08057 [Capsicum chinense]
MDNYILTCFHHGRNVVAGPKFSYKGEVDVFAVAIDKYHYSLFEFLSYAKDLGYSNIEGFYCQHIYGEELVPINSDRELLNFVKDLKDSDELDVFLFHGIDKDTKVVSKSSLLLEGPPVCIDEDDIGSDGNGGRSLDEDLNDRYVGRLGGDEEFIDSSDCDSIDSTNLVDEDVVVGADLLRRRRSSKIRFDDDCVVVVFELGMIFNGPKEFKKALGRKLSIVGVLFIKYLKEDLQLVTGVGLTMMANMQKGFLVVVFDLLPNEVRRCFRHIWSNWSQQWKGEERRKQFWKCSKASFEVKFKEELDYMSQLGMQGKDIVCDLLHYPRQSWVRSFLKKDCKCDVVENNMCETFKSWILISRHKSIIIMLEDIRRKIMTRTVDMIKFANTWIYDFAPMARLILEDNKERARAYKVLLNADVRFEIGEGEFRHTVDLSSSICSCRTWQLRGIPFQHAICALYHVEQEPEPYVEHWYKKKTFIKAYNHFIQIISNMKMWPETNNSKIEPPEPKKMPDRPARNRKRVCADTRKVRSLKAAATSTSCGDTRTPITRGIKSQLPPRNRKIIGHKRGRVETTIDADCGGSKKSKNAGFGIYSSPRRIQMLNIILVDFVREYMRKTSGVIELQDSDGNKKNVYCIRRKMRMILCKGWSKFVRDIGLVVRDAFVGLKYLQIWFVAVICIHPSFNSESQKLLA